MIMGQLVEDVVKKISEGEATYALREAWKMLYGVYPSLDSLALLWSQYSLETARGASIHCANFGNIKKNYNPDDGHDWCMFRCSEIINGKNTFYDPPHIQTHFRAYKSTADGAYDYIKFLSQKKRYVKAWEQIKLGNPAAFSHELAVAGYYTANEQMYTKGIVRLTEEFKNKSKTLLEWKPPEEERRSQLPTVIPDGDIYVPPLLVPEIIPEYHPDQENPKNIDVGEQSFWLKFVSLFK